MHRDNIQIGFSDFGSSEVIEGDFFGEEETFKCVSN
jgi:hypothetical protein